MKPPSLFTGARKPVIGMLHAPALPGSPGYSGDLDALRAFVLADAEALAAGGIDALMLENFGDAPFYPDRVPQETVAALASLATDVRRTTDLPLGINVLRNDGVSAIAVAAATGAAFVRVNVLTGARLADQGILEGRAHEILRRRRNLGADSVALFADIDVKHSAPLADYGREAEIEDTLKRGGADALIVSGMGTGKPVDPVHLRTTKDIAGDKPVLVGSGVTPETLAALLAVADGVIVGTWVKEDGRVDHPVDVERVRRLCEAAPR